MKAINSRYSISKALLSPVTCLSPFVRWDAAREIGANGLLTAPTISVDVIVSVCLPTHCPWMKNGQPAALLNEAAQAATTAVRPWMTGMRFPTAARTFLGRASIINKTKPSSSNRQLPKDTKKKEQKGWVYMELLPRNLFVVNKAL